jgi:hypothetical protein
MTNTAGQKEENFPIFELGYSDTLTGGPKFVRSSQGMLFLRLTSGGAFNWINLRIVSSRIPLKLRYKCLYKQVGTEIDATAEASDDQQCPISMLAYAGSAPGRIRTRSRRDILVRERPVLRD